MKTTIKEIMNITENQIIFNHQNTIQDRDNNNINIKMIIEILTLIAIKRDITIKTTIIQLIIKEIYPIIIIIDTMIKLNNLNKRIQ